MNSSLDLFQKFGLSDKESALYLALLELGPSGVATIARHAEVKRPTAYFVLKELEQKGFVSSVLSGKTITFVAQDPKTLLVLEKAKITELEQALPALLGLASKHIYKPGVKFFTGKQGIKAVYEATLLQPQHSEMLAMGNAQLVEETIPGFQTWYIKRRVAAGIHMRALTPATRGGLHVKTRDRAELRLTRLLDPKEFTAGVEINIYQRTVSIVSLIEQEPVGIIIESTVLAEAQRQLFEILWKNARELH